MITCVQTFDQHCISNYFSVSISFFMFYFQPLNLLYSKLLISVSFLPTMTNCSSAPLWFAVYHQCEWLSRSLLSYISQQQSLWDSPEFWQVSHYPIPWDHANNVCNSSSNCICPHSLAKEWWLSAGNSLLRRSSIRTAFSAMKPGGRTQWDVLQHFLWNLYV